VIRESLRFSVYGLQSSGTCCKVSLVLDINNLSPKRKVIAQVLTKHGIPVWYGIPDDIVASLRASGYVIKKVKRVKDKS
jgi:hypothetical protein